jgi:hypothetical protein
VNDSNDLDVSEFMDQGDYDGEGLEFDDACEEAWKKAKRDGHQSPKWFKVKHHWVKMENPVSEHKVILTPGG